MRKSAFVYVVMVLSVFFFTYNALREQLTIYQLNKIFMFVTETFFETRLQPDGRQKASYSIGFLGTASYDITIKMNGKCEQGDIIKLTYRLRNNLIISCSSLNFIALTIGEQPISKLYSEKMIDTVGILIIEGRYAFISINGDMVLFRELEQNYIFEEVALVGNASVSSAFVKMYPTFLLGARVEVKNMLFQGLKPLNFPSIDTQGIGLPFVFLSGIINFDQSAEFPNLFQTSNFNDGIRLEGNAHQFGLVFPDKDLQGGLRSISLSETKSGKISPISLFLFPSEKILTQSGDREYETFRLQNSTHNIKFDRILLGAGFDEARTFEGRVENFTFWTAGSFSVYWIVLFCVALSATLIQFVILKVLISSDIFKNYPSQIKALVYRSAYLAPYLAALCFLTYHTLNSFRGDGTNITLPILLKNQISGKAAYYGVEFLAERRIYAFPYFYPYFHFAERFDLDAFDCGNPPEYLIIPVEIGVLEVKGRECIKADLVGELIFQNQPHKIYRSVR